MQSSISKPKADAEYRLEVVTTKGLDELIPRYEGRLTNLT